jgi:F0F1-type ATP synthase membrane subunit b/b'
MTNPTNSQPSEAAMAAARALSKDYADTLRGLGHSVTPHDYAAKTEEYAAILQPFLSTSLARVEGERDAAKRELSGSIDQAHKVISTLRADLAAAKAELAHANGRWQASSFREQQDIIDQLREQVAKSDEDLLKELAQLRADLAAKGEIMKKYILPALGAAIQLDTSQTCSKGNENACVLAMDAIDALSDHASGNGGRG